MVAGCTDQPKLQCDIFGPIEGKSSSKDMLVFPDTITRDALELRLKLEEDESLAGFSGSVLSNFAGTTAYSFAVELNGLRRAVAFQTAVEQAHENDGPPLVDIADEKACALLADSVASLDQGQSAAQLGRHLEQVQDYFGPNYPYRNGLVE